MGGARRQLGAPPPPPPRRTCWARQIKSVDGFVFIRLSYFDCSDLQLFAIFIFKVDFSQTNLMTSAENSVSVPQNWKIFWGRIPPDPATRFLLFAIFPQVCFNSLKGFLSICNITKVNFVTYFASKHWTMIMSRKYFNFLTKIMH